LCTVVLFKMKRERYTWVTILPTLWLLACTLTAGLQKIFSATPSIGFLAHARVFGDALAAGKVLAPAKTIEEMHRVVFNDYVNAGMAFLFVAVVIAIAVFGIVSIRRALGTPRFTAVEVGEPAGSARPAHA
jgi:carbon starvation protein